MGLKVLISIVTIKFYQKVKAKVTQTSQSLKSVFSSLCFTTIMERKLTTHQEFRQMTANSSKFTDARKSDFSLRKKVKLKRATLKSGTSKMELPLKKSLTPIGGNSRAGSITSDCFYDKLLTDGYSGEELDEYNQVFTMFDTDGSRSIGTTELGNAMKSLGMNPSDEDLENLIQEVDQDGNGEIDFEEFCAAMKRMSVKGKVSWDDIARECFQVFDRSGSGSITEDDFRTILQDLGDILDKDVIASIFSEFDVDGNNTIDYEEFSNMVRHYMTEEDIESFANRKSNK